MHEKMYRCAPDTFLRGVAPTKKDPHRSFIERLKGEISDGSTSSDSDSVDFNTGGKEWVTELEAKFDGMFGGTDDKKDD